MKKSINEKKDWGWGEEDHEGGMAMSQLHRLNDITEMMLDMLNCEDELPSWVQAKIMRAYTDLNDVFGYLEPQTDHEASQGIQTLTQSTVPVSEGKKKKRGLWANIWARRRAGKRPKRPGEKGYPKTLDI